MKKIILLLLTIQFISTHVFAQKGDKIEKVIFASVSGITPIGIFAKDWNIGGGAYLRYGWLYNNKWSFLFGAGYNKYRLKSDSPYSGTPKLSMLAVQFGGRRYFSKGKFQYFTEVLSGVNFIRIYYKEKNRLVDERDTHVNFQLGGGLSYWLSDFCGIEFSILYNSHLINPSIPYNLTGFEYSIGLNWILE